MGPYDYPGGYTFGAPTPGASPTFDPLAFNKPTADQSWLGANPAVRDSLLAFGANLLAHSRDKNLAAAWGNAIGQGANTWAQRGDYYKKAAEEARMRSYVENYMKD